MKNLFIISCLLLFTNVLHSQNIHEARIIDSLSSIYDDVAPVIAPGGDILYFTKMNHQENSGGERDLGDIWQSKNIDGEWSVPSRVPGPLNNSYYNAVIGITSDGTIMYVVGNYENPRKGGVSFSRKIGEGWSEPKPIDIPYFKNKSDHLSGSLSKDGKIMVLSLEGFGGQGNEDIYYTFRKKVNQWTELRNLGSDINTAAQELTPYLASDNKTLFFSSNGLGGKGSRDVFYSKREDATWASWTKPQNITEINTEGADWYFKLIADTEDAILVNTVNSVGLGDILKVQKPADIELEKELEESMTASTKPIVPYKLSTDTKNPAVNKIEVYFEVRDGFTGNLLSPQLLVKGVNEMKKSSFSEMLLAAGSSYKTRLYKDSIYTVDINTDGYLNEVRTIKTDTISANDTISLELIKLEKGTTIQLKSVLFKRGTSEMQESSYEELDRVAAMLKKNKSVEIELSGHTDNTGSSKLNVKLSQERSDVIKEYLISHGVESNRLSSKGYGGARPIASNKSEATRRLNRRVEFTITKN
ncbi:OmpA family protein [Marivirga sp. S37H4]|uniref:OmpA family protein n=1 Tax=Marivirga aurantiaca TaxID=2802615 RepID=A0A934WWR2_9BACT|nr:OmpA family protein [Marivirga aurantiaca]MBK6264409.1 OmpA family protein [Marivirga aurantiaca]